MATPKRHYHNNEQVYYKRLKLAILGIVLVPTVVLAMFVFFGPTIGSLFGIVSINRNFDNNTDKVAPPPPIFDNPPKAVGSNNITLKGFAEAGTTIKLYVNGPEKGSSVTTTEGTFEISGIELIEGRNSIFAKTIDATGNESDKSATLSIEVDNSKPKIDIESPKNNDVVRNLNKRVFITGKLSEKATITINEKLAVLRPDFTFEFPLGVEPGKHEIKIKATDEAGNFAEETINITYVQESGN